MFGACVRVCDEEEEVLPPVSAMTLSRVKTCKKLFGRCLSLGTASLAYRQKKKIPKLHKLRRKVSIKKVATG